MLVRRHGAYFPILRTGRYVPEDTGISQSLWRLSHGLNDRGIGTQFSANARDWSFLHNVQTGLRPTQDRTQSVQGAASPGVKRCGRVTLKGHLRLVPRLQMVASVHALRKAAHTRWYFQESFRTLKSGSSAVNMLQLEGDFVISSKTESSKMILPFGFLQPYLCFSVLLCSWCEWQYCEYFESIQYHYFPPGRRWDFYYNTDKHNSLEDASAYFVFFRASRVW